MNTDGCNNACALNPNFICENRPFEKTVCTLNDQGG